MNQQLKETIINILLGLFIGITFLLLVIFSGCSPEFHARQALKKGLQIIKTDTLIRIDTVWRVVETVDTVFKYKYDTVTYYQDSVKVVYFYDMKDSLVYIEVDCPDCPEIHTDTIIDNTVLIKEKKGFFIQVWHWFKGNLIIAVIVLIAIGVLTIIKLLK